jgi:CDP-glucose 4,6-dehydratase
MSSGMESFFSGKRVFVTGHTGFKGGWLCEMLLSLGAEVTGYSLAPDTTPNLFTEISLGKQMKSLIADVRDYEKLHSAMAAAKPDMVFHLAAQPLVRRSYEEPRYTFDTNVVGTANVLEAMRVVGSVRAGVMITTDKVYENKEEGRAFVETDRLGGHDPYSASKACAELVVSSYRDSFFNPASYGKAHKTLIASARAGNVVGGGDYSADRLVPDIVRAIMEKNAPVVLRSPASVRPWQHVLDPIYGYVLLAKGLAEGKKELASAFNFAPDDRDVTVEQLTKKAIKLLGKGKYEINPDATKHEMKLLSLDASKAKKQLGWKPRFTTDTCLDWTFDWYKQAYAKADLRKTTDSQISKYLEMQ